MIVLLHVVATVLMLVAALLQVAVAVDRKNPNREGNNDAHILIALALGLVASRLVYRGFSDSYEPPIPTVTLMAYIALALGSMKLALDRLKWIEPRPVLRESLPDYVPPSKA